MQWRQRRTIELRSGKSFLFGGDRVMGLWMRKKEYARCVHTSQFIYRLGGKNHEPIGRQLKKILILGNKLSVSVAVTAGNAVVVVCFFLLERTKKQNPYCEFILFFFVFFFAKHKELKIYLYERKRDQLALFVGIINSFVMMGVFCV